MCIAVDLKRSRRSASIVYVAVPPFVLWLVLVTVATAYPSGSPQRPLTEEQLERKFMALAVRAMERGAAKRLYEQCRNVDRLAGSVFKTELRHIGGRLPVARIDAQGAPHEQDGGEPTLAELFAKERETYGSLLNTTKVMAHCPPILRAAKMLSASIAASGTLPKGLAELVSLRVAAINGCPF